MENKKLEEKAVEYEFSGENGDANAKSFIAGAKFALANQWHDASKELPKEDVEVLTKGILEGAEFTFVAYIFGGAWFMFVPKESDKEFLIGEVNDNIVKYWMPIPELLIND